MALNESHREDLIREATTLTERIEFSAGQGVDPVFAGFRRNGFLSIYLPTDVMFQFSGQQRLRRAFVDGFLYRAQGTTLARLQRERTGNSSSLIRNDLSPTELDEFRNSAQRQLTSVYELLVDPGTKLLRSVPESAGTQIRQRVIETLARIVSEPLKIAEAFPGRR